MNRDSRMSSSTKAVWMGLALVFLGLGAPQAWAGTVDFWQVRLDHWHDSGASGPEHYDFWAGVDAAGVQSVHVTGPGAVAFDLASSGGTSWNFSSSHYATLSDLTTDYPDGTYTFTVNWSGGGSDTKSAVFVTTGSPPLPVVTMPLDDAEVNESQALTLQWNQWLPTPDTGKAIGFLISEPGNPAPVYQQGGLTADTIQYVLPAHTLADHRQYTLNLVFSIAYPQNCAQQAGRLVQFNTGPTVTNYQVGLNASALAQGGTAYNFQASLQGVNVQSVTVTTPGSQVYPLTNDGSQFQFMSTNYSDFASLTTAFPAGTYTFNVLFTDFSTTQVTAEVVTTGFPAFPNITQPANGARVDETLSFDVQWTQWQPAPDSSMQIDVWIQNRNPPYNQVFSAWGIAADATQVTVPPDTLSAHQLYYVTVDFWTSPSPHCSHNASRAITVNTGGGVSYYNVQLSQHTDPDPIRGNTMYSFSAQLNGFLVESVTVTAPNSIVYPLVYEFNQWQYMSNSFNDWSSLFASYPLGSYVFNVNFTGGDHTTVTAELTNSNYPPAPVVTCPLNMVEVNASLPLPITWNQWVPGADASRNIAVLVMDSATWTQVYSQFTLPANTTLSLVPGGTLQPQQLYQANVSFQYQPNEHCVLNAETGPTFATGEFVSDYGVAIFSSVPHGDVEFSAWMDGFGVAAATVTTPVGEVIHIPWDTKQQGLMGTGRWWFGCYKPTLAEITPRFPDGTYTFSIRYTNGTLAQMTAQLTGEVPPNPVITQPVSPSIVDPTLPLTVNWDAWPSPPPGLNPHIEFRVDSGGNEQVTTLPASATSILVPAGTLWDNQAFDIYVRFIIGPVAGHSSKEAENWCNIYTRAKGLEDWRVGLFKGRNDQDQDGGAVYAEVQGYDIKSFVVSSPSGYEFHSDYNEGGGYFIRDPGLHPFLTLADFATQCPDGDYTLTVTYGDNSTEQKVVTVGGAYPPVPNITVPPNHGKVNDKQPLNVAWDQWQGGPVPGQSIQLSIDFGGVDSDRVYSPDSDFSADTRTHTVPAGTLQESQTYALSLFFMSQADVSGHGLKGYMRTEEFQTLKHVNVNGVSPRRGGTAVGTAVTLSGSNFWPGATVTFGGGLATSVSVLSSTQLTCVTPTHAAAVVDVTLTNPGPQADTLAGAFTYADPTPGPVSPGRGPTAGHVRVTIGGTGFAAGATVAFGGVAATNVVVFTPTLLNCITPPHAPGLVDVVVTPPAGSPQSFTNAYTYAAPGVTGATPGRGTTMGGTTVTVTGSDFSIGSDVSVNYTVTFGGAVATNVAILASSLLSCITGPHAPGLVDITVTDPLVQSGAKPNAFTYAAPSITSVTPPAGPVGGGTNVTVVGSDFGVSLTGSILVTFGGVLATNVVALPGSVIVCTTPAHLPDLLPGPVNVMVQNLDGQAGTLPGGFTYTAAAPTVSGPSPALGSMSGGQNVTVTGTNFAVGGLVTVEFGGVAATGVVVHTGSEIACVTPAHAAGAVEVRVSTVGGSNAVAAAYTFFADWEGDVAPRETGGDGEVSIADWVQVGRFAAKLDPVNNGLEFMKADCAQRGTSGDGDVAIADWVQAGRYAAKLDPALSAGGPSVPTP